MSRGRIEYGPVNQVITITPTSLAAGAYRESNVVDNSLPRYDDVLVGGYFTTGTTPGAAETIVLYVYGSVDDTNYTSTLTGVDSTWTPTAGTLEESNLFTLGTINTDVTGNAQYNFGPYRVREAFNGLMPSKWGLVVFNNTSDALNSGSQLVRYQGVYNIP